MAVSREEALSIGKEIADRVINTAHGCRCGIAMWSAKINLLSLDALVSTEQPDWLQPLPQFMGSTITVAEKDCGVNLSQARELNLKLETDIKNQDWEAARNDLTRLKTAIIEPVREGAMPPQRYLDVEGKKYKLVGEEPDEDKAAIWAENMTKSGEKIIVVPLLGRYSLYREE